MDLENIQFFVNDTHFLFT